MEHRLSQRIPAGLGVLLYQRGIPVASGTLRNASRDGLYIVTDFTDIDLNQKLEVEFRLSGRDKTSSRKLNTIVVRKTGHGLALECGELDGSHSSPVRELLQWLQTSRLWETFQPAKQPQRSRASH